MAQRAPRIRALVIEDEAIVARHISEALRKQGIEVLGRAASGEAAIRMSADLEPDLILADVHLHGALDGVDTVMEIQKRHDMAVVYLTAYSDERTLQRAIQTKPSGYIVKPFNEASLRCAVEVALRKHASERDADRRSHHDELTGLYNRRAFLTLVGQLQACARRDGLPYAVVFFDLDGFKRINDELGHARGDRCLQAFAVALRATMRSSDVVARFGGDEFAGFLRDASADALTGILARLDEALRVSAAEIAAGYPLAASVGVAIAGPDDDDTVDDLMARADAAMYADKRARRDRREGR